MKKDKYKLQEELTIDAIKYANEKFNNLGLHTSIILIKINEMQKIFDSIKDVPASKKEILKEIKNVTSDWALEVDKIEKNHAIREKRLAGAGVAGTGAGIAVATLGPNAAIGLASTYGVASTGAAISSLSGATATNAALAWLGGGAVASGGGGMAAGNLILSLFPAVGVAFVGTALVGTGLIIAKGKLDKKQLMDFNTSVSKRDFETAKLIIVELNERMAKIKEETELLSEAITLANTYGNNYDKMTEQQQYSLLTFVNLMNASTQLLAKPILGLRAKFDRSDFQRITKKIKPYNIDLDKKGNEIITLYLANLLYRIDINNKEKVLVWKSISSDRDFLSFAGLKKKEFPIEMMDLALDSLKFKYMTEGLQKAKS